MQLACTEVGSLIPTAFSCPTSQSVKPKDRKEVSVLVPILVFNIVFPRGLVG